ncbi:MAG: putative ABC transporter permease [Clostridia bacterium]|nr:putative ABC transporter permease [Clostridia bacterium]
MAERSAFKGIGFYKLIYIFAVCCVIGFVVETAWCYLRHGYIESRKSLVYGPFSVAYGMGGVLLSLVLYHFADAQLWKIFLISYAVGTAAEYICSLGQEIVFGSVAWDYSHLPLNINGRVCLIYSLMWGALGVFWVKIFMPLADKTFDALSGNIIHIAVWVFVAFFIYDSFLSGTAAMRMNRREQGVAPRNRYEAYLDAHFPDERMHKIYANSRDVEDIPARNGK